MMEGKGLNFKGHDFFEFESSFKTKSFIDSKIVDCEFLKFLI